MAAMADTLLLAATAELHDKIADCAQVVVSHMEPSPSRVAPAPFADLQKADLQRISPLSLVRLADDSVRYVMATHVVQDRVVDAESGEKRTQLKLTEMGA